jgi:hypothetical protein
MTDTVIVERNRTLYALSASYLDVLALLEDPDADADALEQQLDGIAGLLTQKADNIAALVQQFEGMAALRKAEADRMRELAAADQRNADRLRDYLLRHMQALGTEKIDTPRFKISVRTNPPAVQVLEEMLVPEQFIRTVTTSSVDKRAVLEHLKATGEIPAGIDITRSTRLDVR